MLNKINEGIKTATSREDILISEVGRYGGKKARQKNKYSCVFCDSSDALDIRVKNGKATYKCFSCGEYGDVVNLISNKESWSKKKILNYLEENYSIGWQIMGKTPSVAYRRPNISEDKKKEHKQIKEEALKRGDLVTALREDRELEELENSPLIVFKDVDTKGSPLSTWENLEILLKGVNIYMAHNVITKEIEGLGIPTKGFDNQVVYIQSLCLKYGLRTSKDTVRGQLKLIASKNSFNPALDYLEECHREWDETSRIDELISTLKIEEDFPQDMATSLIVKWFVNAVHIANNTGDKLTEGVLVFHGPQGIGKSTWIKNIVPQHLFIGGLNLNPNNTDSVRKATNRWIVELGELEGTTKHEQGILKAYVTSCTDTYRVPYAQDPIAVPRTTIYFGSVNEDAFLKDDTGSRRYWVIPIHSIDWEKLNSIDKDQLWGEIVQLYNEGYKLDLTNEERTKLNDLNKEFSVIGTTQSRLEDGFAWESPKDTWQFMSTEQIMVHFNLKSNKGIKQFMASRGIEQVRLRVDGKRPRGYILPRFISPRTEF